MLIKPIRAIAPKEVKKQKYICIYKLICINFAQ